MNKAKQFMKERKAEMKRCHKLLKPSMHYSKDYDILAINWGQRKVDCTIELSNDLRMDLDKKGLIVGIEIENLKERLRTNKL